MAESGADPFAAYVVSLLPLDGANGATTFPDTIAANTWTRSGSGALSTAQFRFGTASYLNPNGADNRIATPANARFGYGTSDFTIEFWVRFTATGTQVFFDQRTLSTEAVVPTVYISAGSWFYYVNGANRINGGSVGSINQWFAVAVCRVSGTTRLFVNGVSVGSFADSFNYVASPVSLGVTAHSPASFGLSGYMDELRITNGAGRYSANYTPATEAFAYP